MTGTQFQNHYLPAADVNQWLLRQRDQLQAHQDELEARIKLTTDAREKRQLQDELLITNGQLGAVVQTWIYFGRMWG